MKHGSRLRQSLTKDCCKFIVKAVAAFVATAFLLTY